MNSKLYECNFLEWDTEYFGIKSGRVNIFGKLGVNVKKEILDFCIEHDFITFYNYNNLREINEWIGNNTEAFLADLNIQFEKKITKNIEKPELDISIKNYLPYEKTIMVIAEESFKYSRFFNDRKLPQNRAKNIYIKWTENSFEKENKYFTVAKIDNKIAGFIIFNFNSDIAVIELIAVDKNYQGKKIGKQMLLKLEEFLEDKKVKILKVGTQVNNIEAVGFYSATGFKYVACNSVYHMWRNEDRN